MNDRELLELAAKAFGFGAQNPPDNQHCWTQAEYPKHSGRHGALWNYVGHGETAELWNPLTDDGDALRLAVKCNLNVCVGYASVSACLQGDGSFHKTVEIKNDPYAATRLAIVRAAAALGEKMEEEK